MKHFFQLGTSSGLPISSKLLVSHGTGLREVALQIKGSLAEEDGQPT